MRAAADDDEHDDVDVDVDDSQLDIALDDAATSDGDDDDDAGPTLLKLRRLDEFWACRGKMWQRTRSTATPERQATAASPRRYARQPVTVRLLQVVRHRRTARRDGVGDAAQFFADNVRR